MAAAGVLSILTLPTAGGSREVGARVASPRLNILAGHGFVAPGLRILLANP